VSKVSHFTGAKHRTPCAFLRRDNSLPAAIADGKAIDHRIASKFPPRFGGIGQPCCDHSPKGRRPKNKALEKQQDIASRTTGTKPALEELEVL
jgi:hypothetical protein